MAVSNGGRVSRRPPFETAILRLGDDRLAAAEGVETGALVVLDLEQLQKLRLVVRGDHHPEAGGIIGQHQTRCGHVQDVNAPVGQHLQQLVHVELAHRGHDELRKRQGQSFQIPGSTRAGVHLHPMPIGTAAPGQTVQSLVHRE